MVKIYHSNPFRASLIFFRGPDFKGLDDELSEIQSVKDGSDRSKQGLHSSLAFLCSPNFWRPFSSIGVIFILLRLSIFSVLPSYTATIIEQTGTNFDPMLGAVFIGVTRFIANLSTPLLLTMLRKRVILKTGSVAGTASITASKCKLQKCLSQNQQQHIPNLVGLYSEPSLRQSLQTALEANLDWIPLVGICIVSIAHGISGPIIQVLLNESFPLDIRAASVGAVTAIQFSVLVANIKAYPYLVDEEALGVPGTMYLYAAMAAALVIWSFVSVRDTENKSLVEVEGMFKKGKGKYGTNQ